MIRRTSLSLVLSALVLPALATPADAFTVRAQANRTTAQAGEPITVTVQVSGSNEKPTIQLPRV
jgi:hypothetical protein